MAKVKKQVGKQAEAHAGGDLPEPAGGPSPGPPGRTPVVVGLGASAGGLQALIRFLEAMPADSGMAFVLVQHLRPDYQSLTAELLGAHTAMGVSEVVDSPEVKPNHVQVIPPDRYLGIDGDRLRLHEPPQQGRVRAPIDFFFRSLAESCGERAVGIVFSGAGSDGALGLQAIKERGGMTMVQEPSTAEHSSMPLAAIATGAVDYVLGIEDMPETLVHYAEHPYANGADLTEPSAMGEVVAVLCARTSYDFSHYKRSMLARRVQRRMGLKHVDSWSDYLDMLRTAPGELDQLFKDLLIGVTEFFREREAFETLERQVIPAIVAGRNADSPIRVWVPGCATGEEAYSLAMAILDRLAEQGRSNRLQIFASDINDAALETGRQGLFPEGSLTSVSPARLARYFVREDGAYRVVDELREAVVFARHNLISDPPFSRLDLISCRNVLIYLQPDLQGRLLELFHFALNRDGYLFLGSSETISTHAELFESVSKKHRIFRRIGVTPKRVLEFPWTITAAKTPSLSPMLRQARPPDPASLAQQLLLAEHTPAAVLVSRGGEVLYFHGDTDRFLAQPVGEPTTDVFSLARPPLAGRLRGAVHRAIESGERVSVSGARVRRGGSYHRVRITVTPLTQPRDADRLLLITLDDEQQPPSAVLEEAPPDQEPVVLDLERELKSTREELQSTIEELETSNEELKASNEEVLSMNEELQSTNEELETSREELQSLNEELSTLNNQLEAKLRELEIANDDLANLLASTDVATVFLDRDLVIKRYTPAISRLFNLIPSDLGRPLADIARKFDDDHLLEDARRVLDGQAAASFPVETESGQSYLRRVVPYRTDARRIDGVVLTFADVTDLRRAQGDLETANRRLEGSVERRTAMLQLLREVAAAANEAASIRDGLDAVLAKVGAYTRWPFAEAWLVDHERPGELELQPAHYPSHPGPFAAFREVTPEHVPVGQAWLVGRAMADGQAHWEEDLAAALGGERAGAVAGTGVRGVIAFPILSGSEVVGVVEALSETPRERRLLVKEMMVSVGTELGRVVERTALQRRLSEVAVNQQLRLGQELHDGVAQQITGIKMMAETLSSRLAAEGSSTAELAARVREAAEQAQVHVRSLARGLVPVRVEAGGLRAALEELTRRKNLERGGEVVCLVHDGVVVEDPTIATNLYFIAQEAVTNALRHGAASTVEIRLTQDDGGVRLEVRDDGAGFEPERAGSTGSGLRIMAYRARLIAADLEVSADPAGGTIVTCSCGRRRSERED